MNLLKRPAHCTVALLSPVAKKRYIQQGRFGSEKSPIFALLRIQESLDHCCNILFKHNISSNTNTMSTDSSPRMIPKASKQFKHINSLDGFIYSCENNDLHKHINAFHMCNIYTCKSHFPFICMKGKQPLILSMSFSISPMNKFGRKQREYEILAKSNESNFCCYSLKFNSYT